LDFIVATAELQELLHPRFDLEEYDSFYLIRGEMRRPRAEGITVKSHDYILITLELLIILLLVKSVCRQRLLRVSV
jgi:hypothetical protein